MVCQFYAETVHNTLWCKTISVPLNGYTTNCEKCCKNLDHLMIAWALLVRFSIRQIHIHVTLENKILIWPWPKHHHEILMFVPVTSFPLASTNPWLMLPLCLHHVAPSSPYLTLLFPARPSIHVYGTKILIICWLSWLVNSASPHICFFHHPCPWHMFIILAFLFFLKSMLVMAVWFTTLHAMYILCRMSGTL